MKRLMKSVIITDTWLKICKNIFYLSGNAFDCQSNPKKDAFLDCECMLLITKSNFFDYSCKDLSTTNMFNLF